MSADRYASHRIGVGVAGVAGDVNEWGMPNQKSRGTLILKDQDVHFQLTLRPNYERVMILNEGRTEMLECEELQNATIPFPPDRAMVPCRRCDGYGRPADRPRATTSRRYNIDEDHETDKALIALRSGLRGCRHMLQPY